MFVCVWTCVLACVHCLWTQLLECKYEVRNELHTGTG